MDVNVELLSLNLPKRDNLIRISAIACLVLSFVSIFVDFPYNNYFTLGFVVLCVAFILWLHFIGFPTIGRLTFSEVGLTIYQRQESKFLSIDDLGNCKISIQEYSGKTYPTFSLLDYDGTGNFLWIDLSDESHQLRFKLISKQHQDRLIDMIETWKQVNPNIKLRTSWW